MTKINDQVMQAFRKEMDKQAVAIMPIAMGGLYGVDTLSQVKGALQKTNPANAVGRTANMAVYPEH